MLADDQSTEEFSMEDFNLDDEEEFGVEAAQEMIPEELKDLTPEEREIYFRVQEKMAEVDPIMDMFNKLDNKPSEAQIEELKSKVGEVYFTSFGEKKNYIFRGLRRQEWRNLMKAIAKLDEEKKEEAIVQKGVLWPKLTPDIIGGLDAGIATALKDDILTASNFMPVEYAASLVRKL